MDPWGTRLVEEEDALNLLVFTGASLTARTLLLLLIEIFTGRPLVAGTRAIEFALQTLVCVTTVLVIKSETQVTSSGV